jgi:aerobic carbon-monoxide dehydrogenase large subunit
VTPGHVVARLGSPMRRVEDARLLVGAGRYVADLDLGDALAVSWVRSTEPHARLTGVRTAAAAASSGVVMVVTAADLDLGPLPVPPQLADLGQELRRPWLAGDVVRFVGEPIAAVVAQTRGQAEDAAELVEVDYQWLAPVPDAETAARDEVLLFPEAGTNTAFTLEQPPSADLFDDCEVVITQRHVIPRLAPCPLEGRAAAAVWDDDRLTFWVSTQAPHRMRDALAAGLGLDPARVRVRCPEVGGAFGAKGAPYPEELLVAWLARRAGRPLRWVESRSESMLGLHHGRGQVQTVTLGGRRDGTLLAYRLEVLQDCGAYPRFALSLARARQLACGAYTIPRVEVGGRSVVTTTVPVGPYRGAGRPEPALAIERTVDRFAAEIGMDPAELRRRNLVPSGAFPHTTATGTTYDSGDYRRALDLALEVGEYQRARRTQARWRARGGPVQLGIGLSVYVEVAGGGPGEHGAVTVTPTGRAVVRTGSSASGQGHETVWAMLASEQLGIPAGQVEVVHGDTGRVARGVGTMASRSAQTGGLAVHRAAAAVVRQARELAAGLLEASPDDVQLDRAAGRFHLAGAPEVGHAWAELAAAAGGGISAEADIGEAPPTFPSGACLAVVTVDLETGLVRVVRFVGVDDAGRVLNPLLAEGQLHGGVAQGIGQALYEEFRYDQDGNPLTGTLQAYGLPGATELPSFELAGLESPSPLNELGVKGLGEAGAIGAPPAVLNAVVDALAPLGVRHLDLPATPERVWRAVTAARGPYIRPGRPWS